MKLIRFFIPPPGWRFPVILALGTLLGLFGFAFYISKAYSYLSDNPKTCVNCHIMAPQYATWTHNSHRQYANCNDCHVPHNNLINKYYFKAKDGMRHASMFTLRLEPQVIRIKEASHGGSFHAPVETARIVASGIDLAGNARLNLSRLLASLGWNKEVPYPDIDTKEKAQKFIGLDMETLNAEKRKGTYLRP